MSKITFSVNRYTFSVNRYGSDIVTRPYVRLYRYRGGWGLVINAFRTYFYMGKP